MCQQDRLTNLQNRNTTANITIHKHITQQTAMSRSPRYYFQYTNSQQHTQQQHRQQSSIEGLGPYTILCGRSSAAYNHVGNRRFRITINLNLQRYMAATTKKSKSQVIKSIVKILHEDVGARFVKQQKSTYVEVEEKAVYDKVSHSLRDLVLQATRHQKSKSAIHNNKLSNTFETPINQPETASIPFPEFNPFDDESCNEESAAAEKPVECLSQEIVLPEQHSSEASLISDDTSSVSSFSSSDSALTAEQEAEYNELNLQDIDDSSGNGSNSKNNNEWEDDIEQILRF